MVFGGIFGGSGNGNNNSSSKPSSVQQPSEFSSSHDPSSSSSSPTQQTSNMTPIFESTSNPFSRPNTVSNPQSSTEIKNKLITAITEQGNVMNARQLITKVNENCFDHCVTSPGSSLSAKEQGCLSACMEKYIEGWNVVSKSYVSRLQREGAQQGAQQGQSAGSGMF